MIEALDKLIDAQADDRAALTEGEREQQAVELREHILLLERSEVEVIVAGGEQIPYREITDCRALLGVN